MTTHQTTTAALALVAVLGATTALADDIAVCGSGPRITCVVDGDTVWIARVKYRMHGMDAPEREPGAKCRPESDMAVAATIRLANILSTNSWKIEITGKDRYRRPVARFVIGDTTAGEMLVNEGLARPWRGRTEDWCE